MTLFRIPIISCHKKSKRHFAFRRCSWSCWYKVIGCGLLKKFFHWMIRKFSLGPILNIPAIIIISERRTGEREEWAGTG